MNTTTILTGFVDFFSLEENWGRISVRVDSRPQEVGFTIDTQRVVVPDDAGGLAFGPDSPKSSPVPVRGAQVVLSIAKRYVLLKEPTRHTLRLILEAGAWNFYQAYKEAKARCSSLAESEYEVREFASYRGAPALDYPREGKVVAAGAVREINRDFPRGVAPDGSDDPLAPKARAAGLTYRRKFYRQGPGGELKECPDPRPPAGNGETVSGGGGREGEVPSGKEDEELLRLAAGASGRRAGTETPRPGTPVPT